MFNEPVLKVHNAVNKEPVKPASLDTDELFWYKNNLAEINYAAGDLELTTRKNANLISSLRKDGKHRLLIDLDYGAFFKSDELIAYNKNGNDVTTGIFNGVLVDSSTPGHMHFYGDVVNFGTLKAKLSKLRDAGAVQPGFYNQLDRYGMVFLRPWWIKKNDVSNVSGKNMININTATVSNTYITNNQGA